VKGAALELNQLGSGLEARGGPPDAIVNRPADR